jgi:microcystin-dependent protein
MLAQIITENGQKKVIPLTADAGAGNPVGTIIAFYGNTAPSGYLTCDGRRFDENIYPVLYALLGDNHTPDLRESTLKMVGENPNGASHVKSGGLAIGEFLDDRVQTHSHNIQTSSGTINKGSTSVGTSLESLTFGNGGLYAYIGLSNNNGRAGDTTEVKAVGVNFCIKATSGLSENAQDNVINTLNEQRSYSTEEHFTGKYWYNGKKIYEKVITGLALSGVKTDLTNTGITITNLEEITNSISYRANPNGIISGNSYFVSEGGAILYLSQSGQAISKISFEYTKTTD